MRGERPERACTPSLLRYEVARALTRAVDVGQLAESDVELAWRATPAVPIRLHELETGTAVVEVARRLGRRSPYDAAYAQALGAELWTPHGSLDRNAGGLGLPVRLVEPVCSSQERTPPGAAATAAPSV